MDSQPKEPVQPTKEDILRAQYDDWFRHPITQYLIKKLEALKSDFDEVNVANSANMDVPVERFRLMAYASKNTKTILQIIKSSQQLIQDKE